LPPKKAIGPKEDLAERGSIRVTALNVCDDTGDVLLPSAENTLLAMVPQKGVREEAAPAANCL